MKKHIIIITSFVISLIGAIHSHGADEPVRKPLEPSNPNQRNISYCVEVFSATLKEAAKNRRSKPSDEQLYSILVKGLESKKVEQLNYITFKGLSGTRISSETITEQISTQQNSPHLRSSRIQRMRQYLKKLILSLPPNLKLVILAQLLNVNPAYP